MVDVTAVQEVPITDEGMYKRYKLNGTVYDRVAEFDFSDAKKEEILKFAKEKGLEYDPKRRALTRNNGADHVVVGFYKEGFLVKEEEDALASDLVKLVFGSECSMLDEINLTGVIEAEMETAAERKEYIDKYCNNMKEGQMRYIIAKLHSDIVEFKKIKPYAERFPVQKALWDALGAQYTSMVRKLNSIIPEDNKNGRKLRM